MICRKKKTKKGGSAYELLQQCVTESGAQTLLNYGDNSDDKYVKVELTSLSISDVIAKEFKYHRTCYQSLTRAAAASLSATMDENNKKQKETTLQEQCFDKVKSMIEREIIQDGGYIDLRKLSEKYGGMQQKLGLEKRGIKNRHLKVRTINAFGNRITFFQKSEGLPEKIYNTEKINQVGLHDPVEILKKAGRIVQKEILASPNVYSSWPPTGKELLTKKFEVSFFTETLLLSILTSSNKKIGRISRIVNSLARDLIYNASVGKKRVP